MISKITQDTTAEYGSPPSELVSLPMLMSLANISQGFQLLARNKLNRNQVFHTGRPQAWCMCFCISGIKQNNLIIPVTNIFNFDKDVWHPSEAHTVIWQQNY